MALPITTRHDTRSAHPLAIEARGLTKRYGEAFAVKALDLGICEGEVQGFPGPNGAGDPFRTCHCPGRDDAAAVSPALVPVVHDREGMGRHLDRPARCPPGWSRVTCRHTPG